MIKLTIYLDVLLLINFCFDFLLLLVVDVILKRKIKIIRLFFASLIGMLSILLIFIKVDSFTLFCYKFLISLIMSIVAFGYKNIKYTFSNLSFLYMSSIILGGFLYFLKNQFNSSNNLFFVNNQFSANYILLIILSPIVLWIYIKQCKNLKTNYNNYYTCIITLMDDTKIKVSAFMDTGNRLVDPITSKKVVLINNSLIKNDSLLMRYIFVPYNVVGHHSLLKCIKIKNIYIKGFGKTNNVLLGLIEDKIDIDGIDAVLNYKLLEELK